VRAASIKHAEYEILKGIGHTELADLNIDQLELEGGSHDPVAAKRMKSAMGNIAKVMRGMMDKRVKHLPDEHPDKEAV